MNQFLRPILELTVVLPGMFLAYLPVSSYLRQKPLKLAAWFVPLLLGFSVPGGFLCCFFKISTLPVLFLLLPLLLLLYHKTLRISIWKSGSIFLAVCAVFACVNSLSRAENQRDDLPSPYPASSDPGREYLRWENPAEKCHFPVLQTPRKRYWYSVCAAYRGEEWRRE